ncbi:hypothetical protein EUTSA_v10021830mg [Eutrema salsugineum]|uniref:Uncharacterized protein n=1 Tax=Eutrema salsugineum TaxID=72664 RepID=V4M0G4_EUTSA|nr:putative defensin-like protein 233 [Eutrema salsugineum]ESQ48297.1 hypothetical protein EUTSA_v10021830mg [Eutrema salsugineum]
MRCGIVFIVSCVYICFILSHVEGVEAGDQPSECWDEIPFPGKCGFHGNKKCFKEMLSKNQTQRFLRCICNNWEPLNSRKEEHVCRCQRANPNNCTLP